MITSSFSDLPRSINTTFRMTPAYLLYNYQSFFPRRQPPGPIILNVLLAQRTTPVSAESECLTARSAMLWRRDHSHTIQDISISTQALGVSLKEMHLFLIIGWSPGIWPCGPSRQGPMCGTTRGGRYKKCGIVEVIRAKRGRARSALFRRVYLKIT